MGTTFETQVRDLHAALLPEWPDVIKSLVVDYLCPTQWLVRYPHTKHDPDPAYALHGSDLADRTVYNDAKRLHKHAIGDNVHYDGAKSVYYVLPPKLIWSSTYATDGRAWEYEDYPMVHSYTVEYACTAKSVVTLPSPHGLAPDPPVDTMAVLEYHQLTMSTWGALFLAYVVPFGGNTLVLYRGQRKRQKFLYPRYKRPRKQRRLQA